MAWSDEYAPTCAGCREIYAARTPPQAPPCATCRVELLPDNAEVATVYMLTRRQLITRGEQVVDLSIPAIKIAMDALGIQEQRTCLLRVLALWRDMDRAGWNERSE